MCTSCQPQRHGSIRSNASLALLTERALKRGVFRSVAELEKAIKAYIDTTNTDPKPFRWTKTADDILTSIQRFAFAHSPQTPRMKPTSESGH